MSDEEILEQSENQSATDDNQAAEIEELSVEALKEKLEQAEQKAADNWDQLLRTRAEMDNLRRRNQKDLENAHKFALEKFVTELLPVLDSLELGLGAATQDNVSVESLQEGTQLTINMLKQVFEKFNVQEVHPEGEKFNPDHHQAMSMQENAEVDANTVLAVMQKGYLLNERLVRPAMVMVSKAPQAAPEQADSKNQ
ncbi:MAG: nucleotide exchange factor GrpE [Gammaproteobacteria bacterium]